MGGALISDSQTERVKVKSHVTRQMLIAPSEIDGFAGFVSATLVINNWQGQVAYAKVYDGREPEITYSVPEDVPYEAVADLAQLLTEFAAKLKDAVEQAQRVPGA